MYNLLVGTTELQFPDEYIPYSQYIQNIQGMGMNNHDDDSGSGSEDEEPGIPNMTESYNIELKEGTEENIFALAELLKIHYDPTYSNKNPESKKVTDDKFKIEEVLGGKENGKSTIELFEKMGADGVLSLAKLAGYLDIALVKHLCFTWIFHNIYTLKTTREKMNWIGIPESVEEPNFETILHINLETGEIPNKDNNTSSPVTNETDGGVGK